MNFETKKQIQGYHYLVCLHIGYKRLLHECNLLENFNLIQVNDNIIVNIRITSLKILLFTSELRAVDLPLLKFSVVCFGSSFNTLFRRDLASTPYFGGIISVLFMTKLQKG